jgi:hypothetical protein
MATLMQTKITAHYDRIRDEIEFGLLVLARGKWAVVFDDADKPMRFATERDAESERKKLRTRPVIKFLMD